MKKIKRLGICLMGFACLACPATGQKYREGVKYYKCGIPLMAKAMLLDELKQGGVRQAETCYYLGELYWSDRQKDSAYYYYSKGLEADPVFVFNKIGEGKITLEKDPVAAKRCFAEVASGKNKKNPDILLAIAKAYAAYGMKEADGYLEKAREADPHNPALYVFLGDRMFAADKNGEACAKYEQAVHFDPSCTEAYVKYARIYANTGNPQAGLNMLRQLQENDPESLIADHEMAELYYKSAHYKEAAEAYGRCIVSPYCTDKERVHLATILFYYGNYERSLKLAEAVLQHESSNTVMKRILMYDLIELKEYDKARIAAADFFATAFAADLISQDFMYDARLLMTGKAFRRAVSQYEKALEMDSARVDLYKELANAYEKLNCYDSAIVFYTCFMEKGGRNVTLADYFTLGRYHYFVGNTADSIGSGLNIRQNHMYAADSLFAYVAEKAPDSYLGSFWRARVNSALDSESAEGLAKPYYEAAAAILEKNSGKNVRLLVECYSYLGYYYYLKKEIPQSQEYWNKILDIDPQNEIAQKALTGIREGR